MEGFGFRKPSKFQKSQLRFLRSLFIEESDKANDKDAKESSTVTTATSVCTTRHPLFLPWKSTHDFGSRKNGLLVVVLSGLEAFLWCFPAFESSIANDEILRTRVEETRTIIKRAAPAGCPFLRQTLDTYHEIFYSYGDTKLLVV